MEAYTELGRVYHNLLHIDIVCEQIFMLAEHHDCASTDLVRALIAALYHDIYYVPGASDNEQISGQMVYQNGAVPILYAQAAQHCILKTRDHLQPDYFWEAIVLDADLAGLGAEPHIYRLNRDKVRKEYSDFADSAWLAGRSAFLRNMLGRKSIYHTGKAYSLWEEPARENMAQELLQVMKAQEDLRKTDATVVVS